VAASRARIDVLLLQETHYYASTRFHVSGIQSTAKRAGWIAFHAPATATDPKGGVAILVRADSPHVTIVGGSPPLRGLNGRLLGIECKIDNERTHIYSIYLPAKPEKRLEALLKIEQQGLIKHNAIVGGDFNCVDQLHRDTLSASGTYANLHNKKWREIAAKRGLIDIYPFLTNDAPGGFTRLTATVHTRIDRIYGPTENTSWRWIAAAAEPTIFTGKAASDHLPMVVALEALDERPPTKAEAKIKPATLQLMWRASYAKIRENYLYRSLCFLCASCLLVRACLRVRGSVVHRAQATVFKSRIQSICQICKYRRDRS